MDTFSARKITAMKCLELQLSQINSSLKDSKYIGGN